MIEAWAQAQPEAPALLLGDRTWSTTQLAEAVAAAGALLDVDADPTVPLAFVGHAQESTIALILAALARGRTVLPVHPRLVPKEQAQLRASLPPTRWLESLEGLDPGPRRVLPRPEDGLPLAWFGTSGTTGRPKAVELSRRAMFAAAGAYAERIPYAPSDRWLLALPLAHVGGFSILLRALSARIPIVLEPRFSPEGCFQRITRDRATLLSLVPTMLKRLLPLGPPPPSLRVVLLGGASASPGLLDEARSRGWPVCTTYGLTEAAAMVTLQGLGELGADAGRPLAGNQLEIREGRIWVRGPTLMSGYRGLEVPDDPIQDGWLDTGDLGTVDGRGHLWVQARRLDLIVRGGENVYPSEVEAVLEACPGVEAACVFGVEDETYGQTVAMALVLGPDFVPGVLAARLASELAPFKRPQQVAVLPALPELGIGKRDRAETRRIAEPQLGPWSEIVPPGASFD